ncbi:hypothetical protein [Clostridium perfringens]|uniref:hypothetical protein n=1 Tax=Clostridium perfringens TaxID=1502 RepID=UPI002330B191|nr:hypothetical protein [Clostridium perfringens]MDB2050434.1 hypothetical protein [Clostridium perfringens]
MNLRDLIWIDTEDIKKPEMDKHLEKFRGLEDAMLDQKEELRKLAEAGEDKEQNPLVAYSTTSLKKELRRRKGKLK